MNKKNKNKRRRIGKEEICSGRQVNWLDLPSEVMLVIFSKLDVFQILCYAQFVCSSWLQFAKDPFLYRSIVLPDRYRYRYNNNNNKGGMIRGLRLLNNAVNRSSGELKEISLAKSWCTDSLLIRVLDMTGTYLKSLRLASFGEITRNGLIAAFGNLRFLEELELKDDGALRVDPRNVIQTVGRSCPRLKYFSFINHQGSMRFVSCYDRVALSIADYIPHLRSLRLYITCLTNQGLRAILKGCPHLENLDLRGCCYNDLQEDLQKECLNKFRDISFPSSNVAPLPPYYMLNRRLSLIPSYKSVRNVRWHNLVSIKKRV